MTKDEAIDQGFCTICAAFTNGKQLCGILAGTADWEFCQLDLETQARWRRNLGGSGEKPVFGRKTG